MSCGFYFTYRIRPDTKTSKEMLVIGTGFQHLIDSYCSKRAALAEEHNLATLQAHATPSRMVSRLGCRLICSRNAEECWRSFPRALRRWSCRTNGCVLTSSEWGARITGLKIWDCAKPNVVCLSCWGTLQHHPWWLCSPVAWYGCQ
jgi:hypothetical protein